MSVRRAMQRQMEAAATMRVSAITLGMVTGTLHSLKIGILNTCARVDV